MCKLGTASESPNIIGWLLGGLTKLIAASRWRSWILLVIIVPPLIFGLYLATSGLFSQWQVSSNIEITSVSARFDHEAYNGSYSNGSFIIDYEVRNNNPAVTWEYSIRSTVSIDPGANKDPAASLIWTQQYKDGTTDWDVVVKMGKEGWELINAFPLAEYGGKSVRIVFIFKRPMITGGS